MSIEYELSLAGDMTAKSVAERAFPDPDERPQPSGFGEILDVDLRNRYGFVLSLFARDGGSYEAEGDNGIWEWDIGPHLNMSFHFSNNSPHVKAGMRKMMEMVGRVLATGSEDAALIVQDEVLILTRQNGVLHKHSPRGWWDRNSHANDAIPG